MFAHAFLITYFLIFTFIATKDGEMDLTTGVRCDAKHMVYLLYYYKW